MTSYDVSLFGKWRRWDPTLLNRIAAKKMLFLSEPESKYPLILIEL